MRDLGEWGDLVMWRTKSCPRCGGDLFIDRDLDNWYEQYLICAYHHELKNITELQEPTVQAGKKTALAREPRLRWRPVA